MFCEQPYTPELTWWLNLPCCPTPPPASFGHGHSHEWVLKLYHGLLTEMPNDNFEIWRADGQVYCPKSTRATYPYFDSDTVLSGESLYFWALQLPHRGKGGNRAHLWGLWGSRATIHEELLVTVSHTDAFREVLSPHPGTVWGCFLFCGLPSLTLTYNIPLLTMLLLNNFYLDLCNYVFLRDPHQSVLNL